MTSRPLVEVHDGILFDLDGVLYEGAEAIPGATETVAELKRLGLKVGYVTNNASRSPQTVASHLTELGIVSAADEVFGSAVAAVRLLAARAAAGSSVLVTGSEYLKSLTAQQGFTVVESAQERPQYVLQGFEPTLRWIELAEASYAVNSGAEWFATNLDLSIPRSDGIAPGNGALVSAVAHATSKWPIAAGKPEPVMFQQAADTLQINNPLVVGDRLDTDILGGNRAGFATALVLTGIDTRHSALEASADMKPNYFLDDLSELLNGDHALGEPTQ